MLFFCIDQKSAVIIDSRCHPGYLLIREIDDNLATTKPVMPCPFVGKSDKAHSVEFFHYAKQFIDYGCGDCCSPRRRFTKACNIHSLSGPVRFDSDLRSGWKIDIQKDEADVSFEEKVAKAVVNMATVDGISEEDAQVLVTSGFLTIEGILAAEITDIAETTGFDEEKTKAISEAATKHTESEE